MSYDRREDDDEWNTIRVTMSEADNDFEYYIQLVERDKKKVIITREGKDFAVLVPHEINKTSEDKSP
jgi:prevent-host-death family protein